MIVGMPDRHQFAERRAFTFVQLLVVLGIVAVLAAIVIRWTAHARRYSSKVPCAANLTSIYKAMYLYSNDNKGQFPRTLYVPDAPPTWHWDTGGLPGRPVKPLADKPWAGYSNDIAMAVFLTIRTQDITPEVFVCPSNAAQSRDDFGGGGRTAVDKASFSGPANLGYSFANMYPDSSKANSTFGWDQSLSSDFAIAADQNPGIGDGQDVTSPADERARSSDMKRANSLNHNGAGQNILYGDGHVQFESNPFAGMKRDNVYTVSGSVDGTITTSKTVVGSPKWDGDSVLLPPRK
jgi:prepilin-type processing-associated H-X9-DG protein